MSLFGIGGPSDHRRRKRWDELGEILERHDDGLDATAFTKYVDDPCGFARDILGVELWSKQVEIAEAVRDHPQVVVRGRNTVGKDYACAAIALWWVYCRRGGVTATATKATQVNLAFMVKVRAMFNAARARGNPLRGETRVMGLVNVDRDDELVGIHGYTSHDVSSGTGFHPERFLGIASEAQGLPQFAFEVLYANAGNPGSRLLVVGNPLYNHGDFFNISKAKAWHAIKIPMPDHPNVEQGRLVLPVGPSAEQIERLAAYGTDSPQYVARVLAEFPKGALENALFRYEWVEQCMNANHIMERGNEARERRAEPRAAIDIARLGGDRTIIAYGKGGWVSHFIEIPPCDLMECVARIQSTLQPFGFRWGKPGTRFKKWGKIIVDATGEGSGVADRLAEIGYDVTRFIGAKRSKSRECCNARSESYWILSRKMMACDIAVPADDDLIEELMAHEYTLDASDMVKVVPKEAVRSAIGRSPDKSDALAMFVGVRYKGPPRLKPVWY